MAPFQVYHVIDKAKKNSDASGEEASVVLNKLNSNRLDHRFPYLGLREIKEYLAKYGHHQENDRDHNSKTLGPKKWKFNTFILFHLHRWLLVTLASLIQVLPEQSIFLETFFELLDCLVCYEVGHCRDEQCEEIDLPKICVCVIEGS